MGHAPSNQLRIPLTVQAINAPFWKGVDILHDWEPGTTRDLYFGFSIAFAIMPTPFMVEVADLSLMCKKLVDTINAARCRNFKVKDDCIWRVERALEGCNLGKGIGFTAKLVKIDTALVGTSLASPSPPGHRNSHSSSHRTPERLAYVRWLTQAGSP